MKIVLKPHETIKRRRAKQQLAIDADLIQDIVRSRPGIASKAAIASLTGLSRQRVADVIERINNEEVSGPRLDYGKAKAAGGPNAGNVVVGWFVMNRKSHHEAMVHADEHEARGEVGLRRKRLVRFAQAQGIRHAEAAVTQIEQNLGLSIDAMTQEDIDAFEQLLLENLNGSEAA